MLPFVKKASPITPNVAERSSAMQHGPQTANQSATLSAKRRAGGIELHTRNATDPKSRNKYATARHRIRSMPESLPNPQPSSIVVWRCRFGAAAASQRERPLRAAAVLLLRLR